MKRGSFVMPTLIEIEALRELKREVFGPVLHVLRYRRDHLGELLSQVSATGYGLTMGLHTRIDETIREVASQARVGNLYVNRNMVGAVVGVQPFGGEGLSGTGPKAGGPLYMYRLLASRPNEALAKPFGAFSEETFLAEPEGINGNGALSQLRDWCRQEGMTAEAELFPFFSHTAHLLKGPTGERNVYQVFPRSTVLCIASTEADLVVQLAAVLSVGARAGWDGGNDTAKGLYRRLPRSVQRQVLLTSDWHAEWFDAALYHGESTNLLTLQQSLAQRDGPIVPVTAMSAGERSVPLERLVVERAVSIDTTAAGGNASLMTMG